MAQCDGEWFGRQGLVAAAGAPTQQIVARLEREDGWLLARGSAQIEPGAPVEITLFTVMY